MINNAISGVSSRLTRQNYNKAEAASSEQASPKEAIVRCISLFAAAALLAGCIKETGDHVVSRSVCEQSSHALRVHDAKIEQARNGSAAQHTLRLPSKAGAPYHCSVQGKQVHCVSAVAANTAKGDTRQVARLLRERERLHAQALNSCRV